MTAKSVSLFLPDEAATVRLGKALAALVAPGDVVCLEGDLGTGKTALARAVIRTLAGDAALEVPSPSFALVQPYEAKGRTILHTDFYRLADAREIDELGLFDDPSAIIIAEWPERSPSFKKKAAIVVRLTIGKGGEGREATISAPGRDLSALD